MMKSLEEEYRESLAVGELMKMPGWKVITRELGRMQEMCISTMLAGGSDWATVGFFASLRSDEISRRRLGCVRWQQPIGDVSSQRFCVLDIPVNKTGTDFSKPVDFHVGRAIEAWEAVRLSQPKCRDRKTGVRVHLLFTHRARPMRREIINESIIPMLCRKTGVPASDVRGTITSHCARATIASQLLNSREPISLFELQAWLGHGSPASTQHYVAITSTKLAKAYRDAGYSERKFGPSRPSSTKTP
jgi:integrase